MARCVDCGKNGADYQYSEGGYICDKCAGRHFICPDCGVVFPDETYDYNGFCKECDSNHNDD